MDTTSFPKPTAKESQQLSKWIENWDSCSDLQRAICIVFVRGPNQPKRIAAQLNVSIESVLDALPGISGIIVDAKTKNLYFP